jgi:hypothetical protein
VPAGHEAESDHLAWLSPAAAIAAARSGEIRLLPPTAVTLNDFAVAGDLAGILRARPAIAPVEPRLVLEDGAVWLVLPDDLEYPL